MTAKAYAAGGAGERIEWLAADGALGPMALAATAKGLCLLQFLDGEDAAARVRRQFPAADLREALPGSRVHAMADAVSAFLSGEGPRPDLPTDLRGTAFQMRVWAALQAIPPGETPTYGEVAARIGDPRASRAVGGANNKNPVAVVVPCHLVVAAGGKPGGYAGGAARKDRLLALERAASGSDRGRAGPSTRR